MEIVGAQLGVLRALWSLLEFIGATLGLSGSHLLLVGANGVSGCQRASVEVSGAQSESIGINRGHWGSVGVTGAQWRVIGAQWRSVELNWGSLEAHWGLVGLSGGQCAMYIHPYLWFYINT